MASHPKSKPNVPKSRKTVPPSEKATSKPNKLIDPGLLDAITHRPTEPVMVLVEPETPKVKVRVQPHPTNARLTLNIKEPSAKDRKKTAQVLDAAKSLIQSLSGKEPSYIKGANVFVATLPAGKLSDLCGSEVIRAIHPNRQHRLRPMARY